MSPHPYRLSVAARKLSRDVRLDVELALHSSPQWRQPYASSQNGSISSVFTRGHYIGVPTAHRFCVGWGSAISVWDSHCLMRCARSIPFTRISRRDGTLFTLMGRGARIVSCVRFRMTVRAMRPSTQVSVIEHVQCADCASSKGLLDTDLV